MARKLSLLVIHCTDTPEGREVSAEEIRHWHTDAPPDGRGWNQVGYSDMIHLDGSIENLVSYDQDDEVDLWEITNGAAGYNSVSRHVVYVGGAAKSRVPADTRTQAQKSTILSYCLDMIRQYPAIKIAGHNDLNPGKACPSFSVSRFLKANGIAPKNIYKP